MAGFESLFVAVSAWFGFVGSCVAGAGTACRPFLAFVALTAASGAALALLMLAYQALQRERLGESSQREPRLLEPIRRLPEATSQSAPVGGWQVTA